MTHVVPHRLVVPTEVHKGRFVWADHDASIADKLRNGDPALGWEGDPDLRLVRNAVEGRWEVWRRTPLGEDSLVCTRAGDRLPGDDLILALIRADSRRYDRLAQILAADAAAKRAKESEWSDRNADLADRLAHAVSKDLAMPAADGRVYSFGSSDEPQ